MDSPSPPDLEATSNLFACLDLIEGRNRPKKNMDCMDMDLDPETPERMAMMSPIDVSSGASTGGKNVFMDIDTPSSDQTSNQARKRTHHRWRNCTMGSTGIARGSAEDQMFRRAKWNHLITKNLESEQMQGSNELLHSGETVESGQKAPSPHFYPAGRRGSRRKKGKEFWLERRDGNSGLVKLGDKGKGIAISTGKQDKNEQTVIKRLQPDVYQKNMPRARPVENGHVGYLSSSSATKSHIQSEGIDGEARSSSVEVSDQYMNGTDSYGQLQPRRKVALCKLPDGVSPYQVHTVSPDFEGSHADKKKGKMMLNDNTTSDLQPVKAKHQSDRLCSVSGQGASVIADDDDTFRSSKGVRRYTRHDVVKRPFRQSMHGRANDSKGEDSLSHLSDRRHETEGYNNYVNLVHDSPQLTISHHKLSLSARAPSVTEPESRRHQRQKKLNRGKRKGNSVHSTYGECSTSTLEDSEVSHIQSSGRNSNRKSTRTFGSEDVDALFRSDMEADGLHSPAVTWNYPQDQRHGVPDDSNARAWQVESDEILARQLQEQFYRELSGFEGTEVDATLLWPLQQEDTRHASSIARRGQFNPNSSVRSTNHARVPTSSRGAHLRRNFMDLETTLMAEVRRSFNSAQMDLHTRNDFLGALEAAFDISNDMFSEDVLQAHRDFNEDDYEMLLVLDENNQHLAGSSEIQINSLPESVIQSENIEETCAVCLETPSIGDVIRHLPCLHKFHKTCIDTWLRRKSSCPICKSDIC